MTHVPCLLLLSLCSNFRSSPIVGRGRRPHRYCRNSRLRRNYNMFILSLVFGDVLASTALDQQMPILHCTSLSRPLDFALPRVRSYSIRLPLATPLPRSGSPQPSRSVDYTIFNRPPILTVTQHTGSYSIRRSLFSSVSSLLPLGWSRILRQPLDKVQGLTGLTDIQVGGDIKQDMFQFISPTSSFTRCQTRAGYPILGPDAYSRCPEAVL